jgi:hypothetical protein
MFFLFVIWQERKLRKEALAKASFRQTTPFRWTQMLSGLFFEIMYSLN